MYSPFLISIVLKLSSFVDFCQKILLKHEMCGAIHAVNFAFSPTYNFERPIKRMAWLSVNIYIICYIVTDYSF